MYARAVLFVGTIIFLVLPLAVGMPVALRPDVQLGGTYGAPSSQPNDSLEDGLILAGMRMADKLQEPPQEGYIFTDTGHLAPPGVVNPASGIPLRKRRGQVKRVEGAMWKDFVHESVD